ncbi:hypothetical protein EIP91_010774 [Steccherinum ochraceum]|uniref:Uncharacterized protein n=1 Tax=Steccherinum ochraceum TaxID=92696 RepID=A0A4R0R087_9APHY|nr:hypothetical protein EIP91_010774 [Steccherinum ochraceum]
MADIDPRYASVHEQLGEAIGNAVELPFSKIQGSLRSLVNNVVSPEFNHAMISDVVVVAERVAIVADVVTGIPSAIAEVLSSSDVTEGPPSLRKDLNMLLAAWTERSPEKEWNTLRWRAREIAVESMGEINAFINILSFLIDKAMSSSEKQQELQAFLERLKPLVAKFEQLEKDFGTLVQNVSAFAAQWKKIYDTYWADTGLAEDLDKWFVELDSLTFTYSDLTEKTQQLLAGHGFLLTSSGISSSLSALVPSAWINLSMNVLDELVDPELRGPVLEEMVELSFDLGAKRDQFHEQQSSQTAVGKLYLNLAYCEMETSALGTLAQTVDVLTSLVHDATTTKDWSKKNSDEYAQHLEVTNTMYSAFNDALRQYLGNA